MKKVIAILLLMTGIVPAILAIMTPFIYAFPAEDVKPLTLGSAITVFLFCAPIAIFCWLGFRCLWLDITLREYLDLIFKRQSQKQSEVVNKSGIEPQPIPQKLEPKKEVPAVPPVSEPKEELESKIISNPISQQETTFNQDEIKQKNVAKIETLTERQVKAFYKLAFDILEDDEVPLDELSKLNKWLLRYPESKDDYRTAELFLSVERAVEDNHLDKEEQMELYLLLSDYCDGFEAGKYTKELQNIEIEKAEKQEVGKREIETPEIETPEIETPEIETPATAVEAESKSINVSTKTKPKFVAELSFYEECSMVYKDADGGISERDIYFKSYNVNQSGQGYIRAKCLTSNAERTFRTDRIISLVSVESGEVLV